ncbi:MAG TPA: gamma-glutamylcyclotransferase [Devosiaceae bacterium]
MASANRPMQLSQRHLDWLRLEIADPGPQLIDGFRTATDADFADNVERMLRTMPPDGFWLFGYGSLIWKPETAFTEKRVALARGWHRRFCLGWDYRFRGNRDAPGLMMALDRGGQCRGVTYRLPPDTLEEELHKLVRREISMVPSAFPWRWIKVATDDGPLTALTFAMDRKSPRYIAGLSEDEMAHMFATARGFRGSMAEYLHSTVEKLEEMGIHDRNLWRLQALAAERIDAVMQTET